MRNRAFTLIEMMLATVLAVTLMVGVMAVLPRLHSARPEKTTGEDSVASKPTPDGMEACTFLLRDDLRHAGEFDFSQEGQVTLTGFCGLDAASRRRTHRPVQVTYLVATIDGRSWLVRRQAALDVLSNNNVQWDLVLGGVTRFELAPSEGEAPASASSGPSISRSSISLSSAKAPLKHQARNDKLSEKPAENPGAGPRQYDPEEVIMVDGSPAYRKYAPAWALAIHDAKKYGLPAPVTPSPPKDPVPQAKPAPTATESALPSVMIWRLRTWTGEGEPTFDRMVSVQRMPAP